LLIIEFHSEPNGNKRGFTTVVTACTTGAGTNGNESVSRNRLKNNNK
jgi:hypothetical protein